MPFSYTRYISFNYNLFSSTSLLYSLKKSRASRVLKLYRILFGAFIIDEYFIKLFNINYIFIKIDSHSRIELNIII